MPSAKTNPSLRSRIIGPKQAIVVPLATVRSNTVYNYASFIGREYDRVYSTKYDKEARALIVTRES